MYQLINRSGVILNVPTDILEISNEYLSACCDNVDVSQNYGIVAVICECSLRTILNVKGSDNTIKALPILVKKFDTENKFAHLINGRKLIIGRSEVERGYQFDSEANELTAANISRFVTNDEKLKCELINGKVFKEPVSQTVIANVTRPVLDANGLAVTNTKNITMKLDSDTKVLFVSFKIVPLNDAVGSYNNTVLGKHVTDKYTETTIKDASKNN